MRPTVYLSSTAAATVFAAATLLGACADDAPTAPGRLPMAAYPPGPTRSSRQPANASGGPPLPTPKPPIQGNCWPGCVVSGPGRILFVDAYTGNTYAINRDGSDLRGQLPGSAEPSWWPDDKGFVFTKTTGNSSVLVYRRILGQCPTGPVCPDAPLTTAQSPTDRARDGAVDPTGKLVAYADNRAGHYDLYVAVTDGSGGAGTRLTLDPGNSRWPHWSPSGHELVFASQTYNPGGTGPYHITRIDRDGEGLTLLNWMEGRHPAYSPDGQHIAFTTSTKGGDRVAVMDADGNNPVVFKLPVTDASHPSWSRDGKWIAFASTDPAWYGINAMRPDGSGLVHVTGFYGAPKWSR